MAWGEKLEATLRGPLDIVNLLVGGEEAASVMTYGNNWCSCRIGRRLLSGLETLLRWTFSIHFAVVIDFYALFFCFSTSFSHNRYFYCHLSGSEGKLFLFLFALPFSFRDWIDKPHNNCSFPYCLLYSLFTFSVFSLVVVNEPRDFYPFYFLQLITVIFHKLSHLPLSSL